MNNWKYVIRQDRDGKNYEAMERTQNGILQSIDANLFNFGLRK